MNRFLKFNSLILFNLSVILILFAQCSGGGATENHLNDYSGYSAYGERIHTNSAITMSEAIGMMENTDTLHTRLEATIVGSCPVKGCWMDVETGEGMTMKVTFLDYGFFVPKEGLEGKKTVLQGIMTREKVSVETLRHYARDAGKSEEVIAAILEPEITIAFVAEGVLIED